MWVEVGVLDEIKAISAPANSISYSCEQVVNNSWVSYKQVLNKSLTSQEQVKNKS